jgi:hypothetical protein
LRRSGNSCAALGVRVVYGDVAAIPFADGSFSGVVAFIMLHHVPTAESQDRLFLRFRREAVERWLVVWVVRD